MMSKRKKWVEFLKWLPLTPLALVYLLVYYLLIDVDKVNKEFEDE